MYLVLSGARCVVGRHSSVLLDDVVPFGLSWLL